VRASESYETPWCLRGEDGISKLEEVGIRGWYGKDESWCCL
jgi:hypothetical protein